MDSYVLTLFDDAGNPIPIPAIQGVGIKDVRRKGEVLEIELDDGRVFEFAVGDANNAASAESVVNRTRKVQPMVTFVDDDGRAAVWTKLKPLSEQYGIPFVAAMVTNRIGQDNSLTAEQLVSLQDMGWEISSHTMGHVKLSDLTDAEQEEQMRGSKEALEAIGIKCDSICYPFSGICKIFL